MTDPKISAAEDRIAATSKVCILCCISKGLSYGEGSICLFVTARLMEWIDQNQNCPEDEAVRLAIKWTREELLKLAVNERPQ
jgi:hypothetical protein